MSIKPSKKIKAKPALVYVPGNDNKDFAHIDPGDIMTIAGEMINIECGQKLYIAGKPVDAEHKPCVAPVDSYEHIHIIVVPYMDCTALIDHLKSALSFMEAPPPPVVPVQWSIHTSVAYLDVPLRNIYCVGQGHIDDHSRFQWAIQHTKDERFSGIFYDRYMGYTPDLIHRQPRLSEVLTLGLSCDEPLIFMLSSHGDHSKYRYWDIKLKTIVPKVVPDICHRCGHILFGMNYIKETRGYCPPCVHSTHDKLKGFNMFQAAKTASDMIAIHPKKYLLEQCQRGLRLETYNYIGGTNRHKYKYVLIGEEYVGVLDDGYKKLPLDLGTRIVVEVLLLD